MKSLNSILILSWRCFYWLHPSHFRIQWTRKRIIDVEHIMKKFLVISIRPNTMSHPMDGVRMKLTGIRTHQNGTQIQNLNLLKKKKKLLYTDNLMSRRKHNGRMNQLNLGPVQLHHMGGQAKHKPGQLNIRHGHGIHHKNGPAHILFLAP